MESLINFLGFTTNGRPDLLSFDSMIDISMASMVLIVALGLLGTNLACSFTGRNSPLDYVTTFCSLFIGALLANSLISGFELPVNSDLAQTAISANIGMTVSGLLLIAVYGYEGFFNK